MRKVELLSRVAEQFNNDLALKLARELEELNDEEATELRERLEQEL